MRHRHLVALIAAMITVIACSPLFASGSAEAEGEAQGDSTVAREDTVVFALTETKPVPNVGNPYIPNGGELLDAGHHQAMIESLFYLNYETGEIMPWLAESYAFNEDFTELTINLRDGVTWSDGEAFNADDVVFTIEMLQENDGLSYSFDMQQWVENVTAPDSTTVNFELSGPYPRFVLDNFAVRIWGMVRIVPEHIWADKDPNTFRNFDLERGWPVWTGPYEIAEASQTEFVYDRNENWWGAETGFHDLPAPERLVWTSVSSRENAAAMLENNQLDAHPRMTMGLFEQASSRNESLTAWLDEQPYAYKDPCPRTLFVNTKREPWTRPQLRQALSVALDRDRVGRAELGGPGPIPASYPMPTYPPLQDYYDQADDVFDQFSATEYDPERAIRLLEEAGYVRGDDGMFRQDGEPLAITLTLSSDWPPAQQFAQAVISMWRAAGIDARAQFITSAQIAERTSVGEFDVTIESPCNSVLDPYKSAESYHSRYVEPVGERVSANWGRWENAEYDEIIDEMAAYAIGAPEVGELWQDSLEIWLDELPAIPMYQQLRIIPFNTTYWRNWPEADNNYYMPFTWWASTMQLLVNLEKAE